MCCGVETATGSSLVFSKKEGKSNDFKQHFNEGDVAKKQGEKVGVSQNVVNFNAEHQVSCMHFITHV